MTEPDYRVELTNQQRYVLYLLDSGTVYKLDTWTGETWELKAKGDGMWWKPFLPTLAKEAANG